jgi:putative nucleotidyltransferase with HDIG domain
MIKQKIIDQALHIQQGDHLVAIYENESEIVDYITGYVYAALHQNQRCLYIVGDDNTSKILENLNTLTENMGGKGDLVLMNKEESYSKEGKFNPDRMIATLQEKTKEAIRDGYSGLAVTGEISWVLDYEDGRDLIVEYEWKLNERVFGNYPVTALCRYNRHLFSDSLIISIIQLHPLIIWKNSIHENPFFVPPEGFKNNEVSKYQVEVWLNNISRFTNTKSRFQETLQKKEEELASLQNTITHEVMMAMVELLSIHDSYTHSHSDQVAELSRSVADYLNYDEKTTMLIYYAGLIHDIGKTLVSRDILNKPSGLNEKEYEEIKKHPLNGAYALRHVGENSEIANAVKYHHERWDGKGYPEGLSQEDIPLMARILSLADAYDSMTHDRPYRGALGRLEALEEIKNCAGTQFDPMLSKAFIEMLK